MLGRLAVCSVGDRCGRNHARNRSGNWVDAGAASTPGVAKSVDEYGTGRTEGLANRTVAPLRARVQDECHMLFTCPTLSLARLQYSSVFVPHREMREIFRRPLHCSPTLASFVHRHVTASANAG
jgi:hypothetical protein